MRRSHTDRAGLAGAESGAGGPGRRQARPRLPRSHPLSCTPNQFEATANFTFGTGAWSASTYCKVLH